MPTIKIEIPVKCATCGWELESQTFNTHPEDNHIVWFEVKPCPKCNKEMVRLLNHAIDYLDYTNIQRVRDILEGR